MRYDAIRMRLNKISKKAGINKRIHPHLFSGATCMANYLTEAQMNAYFGLDGYKVRGIAKRIRPSLRA